MTTEPKTIVRMEHIRKAKMCSEGARRFWKRHNLDWSDFLSNGIDADVLAATGDALALQVIEVAKNG